MKLRSEKIFIPFLNNFLQFFHNIDKMIFMPPGNLMLGNMCTTLLKEKRFNNLYVEVLFPKQKQPPFLSQNRFSFSKNRPAISYTIHEKNKSLPPSKKINLKGLSIGDGLMSPILQFTGFDQLAYNFAFADEKEAHIIKTRFEIPMVEAINQGDLGGAFHYFDMMLNGDFYHYGTFIANITGFTSIFFNSKTRKNIDKR